MDTFFEIFLPFEVALKYTFHEKYDVYYISVIALSCQVLIRKYKWNILKYLLPLFSINSITTLSSSQWSHLLLISGCRFCWQHTIWDVIFSYKCWQMSWPYWVACNQIGMRINNTIAWVSLEILPSMPSRCT